MSTPKYLNTNYLTNSMVSALSYINYSVQTWQECSNSLNLFLTIDLKMNSLPSLILTHKLIYQPDGWSHQKKTKTPLIRNSISSHFFHLLTHYHVHSLWSWPWAAQWQFPVSSSLLWSLKFCLHRTLLSCCFGGLQLLFKALDKRFSLVLILLLLWWPAVFSLQHWSTGCNLCLSHRFSVFYPLYLTGCNCCYFHSFWFA